MAKKEGKKAFAVRKAVSSTSNSRRPHTRARGMTNFGSAAARETSGQLISHILEISQKPGIKREAIFKKGSPKKIYAYYVLPSDPSKMVREDAEGKKFIGRVTNGKFRVLKSAAR